MFFIISGASLRTLITSPQQFFEILGKEVPLVATYASTIVIIKLFAGLPMYLLRFINLLRTAYLRIATNPKLRTSRNWRRGAALPPAPLYGNIYPSLLMTMLLSFMYSVLAPFVCIFAVLFFAAAGLIFKFLGLCEYYFNGVNLFNHSLLKCVALSLDGIITRSYEYNANTYPPRLAHIDLYLSSIHLT